MTEQKSAPNPTGLIALRRAVTACFVAIAAGQLAFIAFIGLYYYRRTFSGDWAAWNDKPIITGFIAGDPVGNLFFAVHVLLAAVITLGGLVQLIPVLRRRWPHVHRRNGRVYVATALILALGGLWMTWGRGSWLHVAGAVGITLNASLIIIAAIMAWRYARRRNFAAHREWAIRLFVVASAVWFMRIGYMAWALATGGAGIGKSLDGPFDLFIAFANSLLPLAIAELYLRAHRRGTLAARRWVAAVLTISALAIVGGTFGAWMVMWGPYI